MTGPECTKGSLLRGMRPGQAAEYRSVALSAGS
jgi:hypothetical protein